VHLIWSLQYRGVVVKSVKRRKETINYNSVLTNLFINTDCTFQVYVASIITHITGKLHNIMRLDTYLIVSVMNPGLPNMG